MNECFVQELCTLFQAVQKSLSALHRKMEVLRYEILLNSSAYLSPKSIFDPSWIMPYYEWWRHNSCRNFIELPNITYKSAAAVWGSFAVGIKRVLVGLFGGEESAAVIFLFADFSLYIPNIPCCVAYCL